jgi:hypothetical protein
MTNQQAREALQAIYEAADKAEGMIGEEVCKEIGYVRAFAFLHETVRIIRDVRGSAFTKEEK